MYEQLGNIGDFVGGIAVVVTVAYLAVQIRQNTQQQRLNQQDALTKSISEAFDPIYESDHADRLTRTLTEENVSATDIFVAECIMYRIFYAFEVAYERAAEGVLDDEAMKRLDDIVGFLLATPGGERWWCVRGRTRFGPEFVSHIDSLLDYIKEEGADVPVWTPNL